MSRLVGSASCLDVADHSRIASCRGASSPAARSIKPSRKSVRHSWRSSSSREAIQAKAPNADAVLACDDAAPSAVRNARSMDLASIRRSRSRFGTRASVNPSISRITAVAVRADASTSRLLLARSLDKNRRSVALILDSLVYQDSIQDLGKHKAALRSFSQGLTPLPDEFTHQPICEEESVSGADDATIGQRRGVNESGVHESGVHETGVHGAPTPAFVVHLT